MEVHYIGADLSKKSIDLASHSSKQHLRIENEASGFKLMLQWLKQHNAGIENTVVVMEHTGLYSVKFEAFLRTHHIAFVKVSALDIKRSIGMVRGKNDKLDAVRIAAYGYQKRESLKIEGPSDANIERLQLLHSSRERLVKHKAALLSAIKEYDNLGIKKTDLLLKSQLKVIAVMEQQIAALEEQMEQIIIDNSSLHNTYQLLTSIKGVGKILSIATIIKTRNFTKFSNARKFACFCGTAPFDHESGSSIKRRKRVSHLADKKMKSLLDLSAKSAMRYDPELKEFYQRRTEAGKAKMSTINIIRNKIIYRMFAVIKRQSPFVPNYISVA